MRYLCSECGYQIPDGSDFCYKCGAMVKDPIRIDDNGMMISNMCQRCGSALGHEDMYCPNCGEPIERSTFRVEPRNVRLDKIGVIAILLATIPGIFDVFGLGHLVLKRWSKAFMYLCISAILFYVAPSFTQSTGASIMLIVLRVMIFLYQMSDVFKIAYRRNGGDGLD